MFIPLFLNKGTNMTSSVQSARHPRLLGAAKPLLEHPPSSPVTAAVLKSLAEMPMGLPSTSSSGKCLTVEEIRAFMSALHPMIVQGFRMTKISSTPECFELDLSNIDFSDDEKKNRLLELPLESFDQIASVNFSGSSYLTEDFLQTFLPRIPYLSSLNFAYIKEGCALRGLFKFCPFLRQGRGVLILQKGNIYRGNFKAGVPHGEGTLTRPKGAIYKGEWQNGKKEGRGTILLPDGSSYTGGFKNNAYHGQGKLTLVEGANDGAIYEGIYYEGVFYEGGWVEGKKEGIGRMRYEDGCLYEGEFKQDKQWGLGKFTTLDGFSYLGEWDENGQLIRVR